MALYATFCSFSHISLVEDAWGQKISTQISENAAEIDFSLRNFELIFGKKNFFLNKI